MTKIPAIKGEIGNTIYYIANLTFNQVSLMVSRVNDELHTANSIKEVIQRSLTDNYLKIKDYIVNRDDHFFDSLVLAIYDGDPQWREIRYEIGGELYPNVGLLELTGQEKIFPVDGQHRVEGIKAALQSKPSIGEETISVVLIGHANTPEGRERSRRIFSTLNRYVKPVRLGDIIALDEDDVVAIVTRDMLESYPLFRGQRVRALNSKAMPVTDKSSFTTLMTLYSCHMVLFDTYISVKEDKKYTQTQLQDYLKYRPSDEVIEEFKAVLVDFWDQMQRNFEEIGIYVGNNSEEAAAEMRSTETGGNLFFRPVGLLPFVEAVARIRWARREEYSVILRHYMTMNRIVSLEPWGKILWNPIAHKMVMRNQQLVKYMLIYMYARDILSDTDKAAMATKYATVFNLESREEAINQIDIKTRV